MVLHDRGVASKCLRCTRCQVSPISMCLTGYTMMSSEQRPMLSSWNAFGVVPRNLMVVISFLSSYRHGPPTWQSG